MRRLCGPRASPAPGGTCPHASSPAPPARPQPHTLLRSGEPRTQGLPAVALLLERWAARRGCGGGDCATPPPPALWLSNPRPCGECSPLPQVMNNISGPKAMFQKNTSLGGRPTCPETVLPCGFGQVTRQPFIQPSPRAFPPATNQARVLGLDARPRDMGHSQHLSSVTVCPGTRGWHFSCVASLLSPRVALSAGTTAVLFIRCGKRDPPPPREGTIYSFFSLFSTRPVTCHWTPPPNPPPER